MIITIDSIMIIHKRKSLLVFFYFPTMKFNNFAKLIIIFLKIFPKKPNNLYQMIIQ